MHYSKRGVAIQLQLKICDTVTYLQNLFSKKATKTVSGCTIACPQQFDNMRHRTNSL